MFFIILCYAQQPLSILFSICAILNCICLFIAKRKIFARMSLRCAFPSRSSNVNQLHVTISCYSSWLVRQKYESINAISYDDKLNYTNTLIQIYACNSFGATLHSMSDTMRQ